MYDVNGAYRENGEGRDTPRVYHPYGDTAPAYDEYADPAAAHGWQNAYDDTVRIEFGEDPAAAGSSPKPPAAVLPDAEGRHERLMRRRRVRLRRRGAVAAGVACVGLCVVVITGLFGSESSGDGGRENAPNTLQSSSATDRPGSTASTSGDPSGASREAASGAPNRASASPSPSTSPTGGSGGSEDGSGKPAKGTPSPTATTTTEPGRGNGNPGRGQGATKGPK
ncbi:hypothetical protein [Streptomyces sporangiiformans]|uniref:Uncharacterized protein n=1 Tax=Streptomyces sporangiiformans TaxID=2315329 RepID=A0A505D9Z3_9ACTN|nr:hypothetical protein [Streptomyces sporangiiformans]TPQ19617.1 hypothetical protein FGD71_024635 [Streptomyces sporangiiformans]